jgi:hypothetical protein
MIAVSDLAHGLLAAQTQQLGGTTVNADQDPAGPSPAATSQAGQAAGKASQSAATGAAASQLSTGSPAGTLLVSSDGSVMATCLSSGAYLLYWSPDQGFQAEDVHRGPAALTSVLFRGPAATVVMRVSCSGSTPIAHVYRATDGGDDGGGSGGE